MTAPLAPRCGKTLLGNNRVGGTCARPLGHPGRHQSAEARDHLSSRRGYAAPAPPEPETRRRDEAPDLSWQHRGACRDQDPELFFPEHGDGRPAEALRICRDCPVRIDCLRYAIRNRLRYGVYGGLTPQQRGALHKAYQEVTA